MIIDSMVTMTWWPSQGAESDHQVMLTMNQPPESPHGLANATAGTPAAAQSGRGRPSDL
ncbi:hypothetical protein BKA01_006862 [Pseudonocardia eucalypti]|uniref:hypothetical protein n=1 Tax=Pseudonocardia eucalypti TaxID=648755 RepID=UPI00161B2DF6|nr:hypothetical protein [Pseudonocardia eucalypti]